MCDSTVTHCDQIAKSEIKSQPKQSDPHLIFYLGFHCISNLCLLGEISETRLIFKCNIIENSIKSLKFSSGLIKRKKQEVTSLR